MEAIVGYRLSPRQRHLWALLQNQAPCAPDARALIRLRGPLEPEALHLAVEGLAARHEALRTSFARLPGMPEALQVVGETGPSWQADEDLRGLAPDERDQRLEELWTDGAAGEAWARLVRTGDEEHLLLLRVHTLSADVASLENLARDLAALYAGAEAASSLEAPVPYLAFSEWLNEVLASEQGQAARRFWIEQCEGPEARLLVEDELPPGDPASLRRPLRPELAASLAALAGASGASTDDVLLAAWVALLHRLSRAEVVRVGAAFDGRTDDELRHAVGPFTQYLPLAVAADPGLPFAALVERVREAGESAAAWQECFDGEAVQQFLGGDGAGSDRTLRLRFGFTPLPETGVHAAGPLELSLARHRVADEAFAVHLLVSRSGGDVELELRGDGILPREQLGRLLERYEALLADALARPGAPVGHLAVMNGAELSRVLAEFNETGFRGEPDGATVHALFEAQAERTPDAEAVSLGSRSLSYAELNRGANRRARHLRALGIGPESRVGIMLPSSPERVETVLAVLKAGAAYVPLDPAYPRDRLDFMIRDAGLPLVVSVGALRDRIPGVEGTAVLAWDEEADRVAALPDGNPELPVDPACAAYVIYTSGSTGTPKGVVVEHGALVAHAMGVRAHYELAPGDRILQFASFNFDASVEQLLPPLLSGACVVLRGEEILSTEAIGRYVAEARLSILNLPTAQWHLLAEEWARGSRVPDTGSLRLVIAGGEAMLPHYVARWREAPVDGARLLNAYGPTETVVTATTYDVPGGPWPESARRVPIGRPFGHRSAYVLDGWLEPVPVGMPGELCIGGGPVARGYLGRAELTAERFVPDPFGRVPGGRLYRTGDLVRFEEDGALVFLGRVDEQVKVRGFRIEPGEIEAVLERHPGVREAVVAVREDAPGEKRLAAYVVPRAGEAPAPGDLRVHVQASLPEYMVPGAIVVLERLPLTPNGKVDRKALPAPEGASTGRSYVAPENPTQELLARIMGEVLRLERVGIHDEFFEMGGDSILSIQVVSRARAAGLHLTPRLVFDHPTVAELALVCEESGAPVRAEQGTVTGTVELGPIQAWFFSRGVPDRHHFNLSQLFEVHGRVDGGALERAVSRLLEHHDALRMRFRQTREGWVQENAPLDPRVRVTRVDLAALDGPRQREAVERAAARLQASLELESGLLLRVACFDRGEGSTARLLMVVHHLVVDGVSWRVLVEDLQSALAQAGRGEQIRLPEKTTSFQHWAGRLGAHARGGGFDAELAYWTAAARRDVAPLPVDHPEGAGAGTTGSIRNVALALGEDETQALLQEVPRAYRTQINDVLLTAMARTLAAWAGGARFLVDVEGHGREDLFPDVDLSRTVGWLTTVYPVLLDLSGAGDEGAALKSVKEQLRAVPNRGIGYGALRHLGSAEARERLAAMPQAEVWFEYLGQFDQSLSGGSLLVRAAESAGAAASPRGTRTHPLALSGAVLGGRLRMWWGYSPALHRAETVERLAAGFLAELRGLIAHCTTPGVGGYTPSDFPLARLPQGELDRVVGAGHDVEDVYPLSPAQEGILFHTLYAPGEGAYVGQFGFDLVGELDFDAFRSAWQGALDRHPVLRTGFAWEGLDTPVQVVRRQVALPIHREDWSGLAPAEQEARRAAYLAGDRVRGFHPGEAPLMRLALFRVAEDRHHLVCTQHHLIVDGWSLPLLFRDVAALYGAFTGGPGPELAPARPFRDLIAWLGTRDLAEAERFWRETLAGFTAPTPLGIDTAYPAGEGSAHETLQLPAELSARIEAAARRHGLTVNTLVQGAWAVLLARYGGEDDVVFGATLSGRPPEIAGVEGIVGLFINTLPVRVRVRGEDEVLPWLRTVQALNAVVREHQHTPLAQVQRWSEVPAGHALFESILVFENYPVGDALGEGERGLRVAAREAVVETNYPLTLSASLGRGLVVRAEYQARRFEAAAVGRMLGHAARVLDAFASDPRRPLASVPLLGAEERERLLGEWSAPAGEPPRALVHRLISEQALLTPDAVAVRCGAASLTYAELDARAGRLARRLRGLGVGPEVPVGVCLERSPDLVVAVLGVLGAGGAFVPLDPGYPVERLEYVVRDSGAAVVLAHAGPAARLAGTGVRLVQPDAGEDPAGDGGAGAPEDGVGPEGLAYVIYTSGSTGAPKGVRVEHRSLSATLLLARRALGFGPGDEMPSLASHAFDIWLFETLLPLLGGAAVRMVPGERVLDPSALMEEIRDATLLHAVPALMRQIVERAAAGEAEAPRLRQVFVGGDAVAPDLLARMREVWPAAEIRVLYGPTEAAIICATHLAEEGRPVRAQMIGRPLGNARLYVCGPDGEPVPVGVPGELRLGGDSVARDYLGRPALTAERFVPDPLGGEPGARLYRTGDRVRWSADAALEFLGRTDQQVKVRGFRIEPGEVEAALLRHAAVRDALVVAREDRPGERRLVAYLVGGAGLPGTGELRAGLREILPEHMVPAAFVALEAFPLTPNGKVDRARLPDPGEAGPEREFVPPRDPVEEIVAATWSDVLGVERVGASDDLFELGGDSLLVMRIAARLRAALRIDIPLAVFFTHTRLSDLARWIGEAEGGGDEGPSILPADRSRPLPLSFPQERLWFLDRAGEGGATFTIPLAIRLEGEELDVDALAGSFATVIERHEALRTVFPSVDGEGRQLVLPPAPFALPLVDLQRHSADVRAEHAARIAASEAARPFDLERGPLVRAVLLRLGRTEHVLLVNLHHIVFDGWSTAVLVRELTGCYEALRAGRAPLLPELPVQYADYAAWQRAWLGSPAAQTQLLYWKRHLAGVPTLDLAAGRPRPERPTLRGSRLAVRLGPEVSARVRASAQEQQVTLFMFLLAAFKVVLAHHGRTRDLVVGADLAGRSRVETEPLIGFFINEMVLRTSLAGDPTFADLLRRVRAVTLDAYRHQDVPFALLVRELGARRSLGTNPLFQVMFGLDNTPRQEVVAEGLRVSPVGVDTGRSVFDLCLYMSETGQEITGSFDFRTDLFDAPAVEAMKSDFLAVVERGCENPELRLEALLEDLAGRERDRRAEKARAAEQASRVLFQARRRKAIPITPPTD